MELFRGRMNARHVVVKKILCEGANEIYPETRQGPSWKVALMTVLEEVRPVTLWDVAAIIETMAGETRRYSIMMPDDLAEAVRELGGEDGLSAYVVAAVRRQVQHDRLASLVAAAEDEIGPITDEEIHAKWLQLSRAERGTFGTEAE
ncbi:hypothetical protein [Pseudofrankia sp. BMG5.37]|nr:hypothetical protein [Pseudofrankia sp. BMG5.37]MDT3445739.1 hypothetical protein [Pseudofrankia sp. BMG5.37]